jgi:hypothetical protein
VWGRREKKKGMGKAYLAGQMASKVHDGVRKINKWLVAALAVKA